MKQRVNHARKKEKVKKIKLKAFFKKVLERREAKLQKASRPKGETIKGKAELVAKVGSDGFIFFVAENRSRLNQRQRRKLWRQVPHMRKKYKKAS